MLRRMAPLLLVVVVAGIFLCLAQRKVHTFVCGNDPMLYIRAARTLSHPAIYGASELRRAMTFTAPGYPLLLAGVMAIFGDLSPYFLNAVLMLMATALMWRVLSHVGMSPWTAALSTLGWLYLVFNGYALNPPYLLYPFREAFRLVLVLLAYLLAAKLAAGGRWRTGIAALAAAAGACLVREPSAVIIPGLVIGTACLARGAAAKRRALLALLVPGLLACVIGAAAAWLLGLRLSSQVEALRYLRNTGVMHIRLRQTAPWFIAQFGVVGCLLGLLGIARSVRGRHALLWWFLVPGLTLYVFYCYMQSHYRYFLTTVALISVFVGYGSDTLIEGLARLANRRLPKRTTAAVLRGGALLLVSVALILSARGRAVWGPPVPAREVRDWQARVQGLQPDADGRTRVALEQRCRYLEDLLLSYTDVDIVDPKRMDTWPAGWRMVHYFHPLNRAAEYAAPQWLERLEIYALPLMADVANVSPVAVPDAVLGGGRFAQYRVRPWTAGTHVQTIQLLPGAEQVVWLDLASSGPGEPKTITIGDAGTTNAWVSYRTSTNGWVGVLLGADQVPASNAFCRVVCASPVPAAPVVASRARDDQLVLPLGPMRRISTSRILPGLGVRTTELAIDCGRELTIRRPALLSTGAAAPALVLDYHGANDKVMVFEPQAMAGPIMGSMASGYGGMPLPGGSDGETRGELVSRRWPCQALKVTLLNVRLSVSVEQ